MSNAAPSSRKALFSPNAGAVWLVFGWLAFWLGTVAYPCLAHPASSGGFDQTVALEVATSQRINPAYADSQPAHDDATCHRLSAPDSGAPVTAAGGGTPNVNPAAPVAPEPPQLTVVVSASGILPVSQPLPRTPLYLRTQRLLI